MTDSVVANREPEFRFQAMRFFQVIETGINYLGHLDDFNQILDNLGRRHGKLKQSFGFQPYFWSVFLECSVYQIRLALERSKALRWSSAEVDKAVILWRHLMQGICKRIEAGFLADASKRLQVQVDNDVISPGPEKSADHESRVPLALPVPDVSALLMID
uniref:GLOBIN domain-containing protein n=1 Tax=Syphacia muris TaxID=451379 RepID=A0A0N5AVJ1_9BILA